MFKELASPIHKYGSLREKGGVEIKFIIITIITEYYSLSDGDLLPIFAVILEVGYKHFRQIFWGVGSLTDGLSF